MHFSKKTPKKLLPLDQFQQNEQKHTVHISMVSLMCVYNLCVVLILQNTGKKNSVTSFYQAGTNRPQFIFYFRCPGNEEIVKQIDQIKKCNCSNKCQSASFDIFA